jgi:drug/metabolite transporter (DMT)-like permease
MIITFKLYLCTKFNKARVFNNMKNKSYFGHIAMFSANLMWGLNSPIAKRALLFGGGVVSSTSLTLFRMFGACILFWIASIFTKKEHVHHDDMLKLFFAALFGVVLNQGTFIYGLSLTSPIDASIVTTTMPIITMIVAALYLKEPVTGKKLIGIFFGASGALILIITSKHTGGASRGTNSYLGDLLCMTAQLSFAIYLTFFKDLISKYSPITLLKWMFMYASICFIPFSYHDVSSLAYSTLPWDVILDIMYVVVCSTFLAYVCVPIGQKYLRPTVVSMYNYIQPIVAAILTVLLGMDTFGITKLVAVICVFSGVYFVTQSKSKAQLDALKAQQEANDNKPTE